MQSTGMREQAMRQQMELRFELARFFRSLRMSSRYAKNLSAAARAAEITPSYLHRIEGAEVIASAECVTRLCKLYGASAAPILGKMGKLDPSFEERVLERLDSHYELLERILHLPADRLGMIEQVVKEVGDGCQKADTSFV